MFAVVTCLSRWTASSLYLFPSRIRQGLPDFERELDGDGDDSDDSEDVDVDGIDVADTDTATVTTNFSLTAEQAATAQAATVGHASVSLGDSTLAGMGVDAVQTGPNTISFTSSIAMENMGVVVGIATATPGHTGTATIGPNNTVTITSN